MSIAAGVAGTTAPCEAQGSTRAQPVVAWQRSLADAQHLSKTLKLPMLVVANQDGEQACESLVRGRYRDPAFAKLAGRYVTVVASVDRHNPRDFDADGNRIPCPRFGCVTCGEHIRIEPKLFAAYFKNRRTAPRHIGIGTDGKEMFDRFLDNDLRAIDNALRANADQKKPMPDLRSKDRTTRGLLRSRADADRREVEKRFREANTKGRAALLRTAASGGNEHPDLVRLGLMDDSADVRRAATTVLAKTATADTLDLTLQFLGRANSDSEYTRLMKALERPAGSHESSSRALSIRRALRARAPLIDPEQWRRYYRDVRGEWAADAVPDEELAELDDRLEANTKKARSGDPGGKLAMQIARDNFRYALNRLQNQKDPTFLLQDADTASRRAVTSGFDRGTAAILRARILFLLNKPVEAGQQAILAISGTPSALAKIAPSPDALTVLDVHARARRQILQKPIERESDYPAEIVTAIHRTYEAIVAHPLATAKNAKEHVDFLLYLGARREAGRATRAGVRRFPADSTLHQALRDQVIWESGFSGLESAYASMQKERREPAIDWYAGYAALIAAEGHSRAGDKASSVRAYRKSIDELERSGSTNPAFRDSAQHYIALCRGGIAKIALDAGELDEALRAVLAGASARPASFASRDGLGNTLQRTARRLRRRLAGAGKQDLDAKLSGLGISL